jgi:predicted aspartyl protease
MKSRPPNLALLPLVAILLVLWAAMPCHAFQIEIRNNKLSVQAKDVPLQTLLKELAAEYGITLRMDPSINPLVTASFTDRDLKDGLQSILKPYNHVLYWRPATGDSSHSSTAAYRLDEIHIFRPGEKRSMVAFEAPPEEPEPESEPESGQGTQDVVETKVIIKGNKVFVPVTLTYGDNEVNTTLLFDTGASSIVLHQSVADELGIEEFQSSRGQGVGGVPITTRMTRLTTVEVGPHTKRDLRADIVAYRGAADADYNGLLGMNFLRGLKYTIDFERQTIRWER